MNSLAAALATLSPRVAHVLPVSDDGGSTAEIVRVLGGPAVGDIRSRCLRLSDVSTPEARAVKTLLQHRLPRDGNAARSAWLRIVEGKDPLWDGIETPYKATIRAFLVHFHTQILVHAAHDFDFANGSVGNFFFAGARLFLNSLNAAIFLYSRVSGIPPETAVLPVLRSETDRRVVLGAVLADGTLLRGQNTISHPPPPTASPGSPRPSPAVLVDKAPAGVPPLPSPIGRVCYLSPDAGCSGGDFPSSGGAAAEYFPPLNPLVAKRLRGADAILYGCGSLYTSICPSLIVRGIGEEIAARSGVPKVLMLNGSPDRETSGMSAVDYVRAVTGALNREGGRDNADVLSHPPSAYVTVLVYPRGAEGEVPVDTRALERMGVRALGVPSRRDASGRCVYDAQGVVDALSRLLDEAPGNDGAGSDSALESFAVER